jgi:diaminopimelate decarboxylase
MVHVGADLFLRKCYRPEDWHHEITVLDQQGKIKSGRDKNKYIIAGPLCFAGDILAKTIELPSVEKGDFIIIHDAGAYTLGMWSRYNSRQIPKVIGYYADGKRFEILKERESLQKVWEFWN